MKTPGGHRLAFTAQPLADAVAEEWRAQKETILPTTMPLTQLSNAAIDLTPDDHARITDHLAGYAATELLCYREPQDNLLRAAQEGEWEHWLCWAEQRYDLHFERVAGIMPVAQPAETLARMRRAVAAQDHWRLVALNTLTGGLGSLVLALAVSERALTAEAAFHLSHLEQHHQENRWGEDAEARRIAEMTLAELRAAERFLGLL